HKLVAMKNPLESLQEEAPCPICLQYFTGAVTLQCRQVSQCWEGSDTAVEGQAPSVVHAVGPLSGSPTPQRVRRRPGRIKAGPQPSVAGLPPAGAAVSADARNGDTAQARGRDQELPELPRPYYDQEQRENSRGRYDQEPP
uniref:Uncharacterized protein n=1 Tax=Gopherus evgoodei TaxID=1825980 RepID=A0A8C4YC88_9SAUR